MSVVYLDPSNLPAMQESARQAVNHLKTAIEQRTILPMIHADQRLNDDGSLNVVPALVDPMTTRNVELFIDAVRTAAWRVANSEENHCRCAERYNELEDAKLLALRQFAEAKPTSSKQDKGTQILNARLEEIDKEVEYLFKGRVPQAFAKSMDAPPCEICGKPLQLSGQMAYTDPDFLQNLVKLSLGGEFPLNYLPLLLEAVDTWIYNPDIIPPAKKKRVDEVLTKFKYLEMKDLVIQKIVGFLTSGSQKETPEADENARLTSLIASSSAAPNTTPDATATSPMPSDSARPTLTDDSRPTSNDSSTSSTSKPDEN